MIPNWNILVEFNQQLEIDIQHILSSIQPIDVPKELLPYKGQVVELCNQLMAKIRANKIYISIMRMETLNDIVDQINAVDDAVKLANKYLLTPLVRARHSDQLTLLIIQWLHGVHPKTCKLAAAFCDGGPQIKPFIGFPPIYLIPFSMQQSLLHLPLLFHEFGHLLFVIHEPEMTDIVRDYINKIQRKLVPISQRSDGFAQKHAKDRKIISDTWYPWLIEIFCDAVGFSIGGPSFIHAFSSYLNSIDKSRYSSPPEKLGASSHPITWLRIQLLTDRAALNGYTELAKDIRQKWEDRATLLSVREDYYGFYLQSLNDDIRSSIDDMLVEAAPLLHTQNEANAVSWTPLIDTPVMLMNWAWERYFNDFENFATWEKMQIERLLKIS